MGPGRRGHKGTQERDANNTHFKHARGQGQRNPWALFCKKNFLFLWHWGWQILFTAVMVMEGMWSAYFASILHVFLAYMYAF